MTNTFIENLTPAARTFYMISAALYTLRRDAQLAGNTEKVETLRDIEDIYYDYIFDDSGEELEDVRYYSHRSTGEVCDYTLPIDDREEALYIARQNLAYCSGFFPKTAAYHCMELLDEIF